MTVIGFVRHGVTAWNKEGRAQGSSDVPLDEEGIKMAGRVAKRLSTEQWDAIYTSHLSRAKKTAEIIAEKLPQAMFVVDQRLAERGGGLVEGTTEAERIEKWGINWKELDLGFEPHDAIIERGMAAIRDIKEKHPNERVLLISHGAFIKRLFNELIPDEQYEKSLDNTSVTIVELSDERNRCHLFNCTAHLKQAMDA